jgi:ABC-type Co2+ transport system permease subunit
MYIGYTGIPAALGVAAWAAVAVSLAAAAVLLRRHRFSAPGLAGATALVAALRLVEFPLHQGGDLAGGVIAAGFVVVVFGPAAGVWMLTIATLARAAAGPPPDAATLGVNCFAQGVVAPWAVAAVAAAFRGFRPESAARYVGVFVTGAAGPIAVAAALAPAALATGAMSAGEMVARAVRAALTLAVPEGVLATWGYALTVGGPAARGEGRWFPRTRAGWWLAAAAAALAAFVPLAPPGVGALGPFPTLARAIRAPYPFRLLGAEAVVGAAAVAALAVFGVISWSSSLRKNKTGATP